MRRRLTILLIAIAVFLAGPRALADDAPQPAPEINIEELQAEPMPDYAIITSGAELYVPSIKRLFNVPAGARLLTAPSWDKLEVELRRLQDEETRRLAENKYLRDQAASWRPGWKTLLTTTLSGFLGGVYAYHRLK